MLFRRELIHSGCGIAFRHQELSTMKSMFPGFLVFVFCTGMPEYVMKVMAVIFNNTLTAKYFICFRNKSLIIDSYGFKVQFMGIQCSTKLSGPNNEHKTCYFYKKNEGISSDFDEQSLITSENQDFNSLYNFAISDNNNHMYAIKQLEYLTHLEKEKRVMKTPNKYGSWII